MTKKILFISLFMCLTTLLKSQILIGLLFGDKLNNDRLKFGLDVGLNYSTLNNYQQGSHGAGLTFGLFLDVKLNDRLYITPEFLMINRVSAYNLPNYSINDSIWDIALEETEINRNLYYFSLPVLFKVRAFNYFYLSLGPQISYLTKAEDNFYKKFNQGDVVFTRNIEEHMNNFDLGAIGGIEYSLLQGKGMVFKLRYYHGFGPPSKSSDPLRLNAANQYVQFTISIPIGVKPKEKEPEEESP